MKARTWQVYVPGLNLVYLQDFEFEVPVSEAEVRRYVRWYYFGNGRQRLPGGSYIAPRTR